MKDIDFGRLENMISREMKAAWRCVRIISVNHLPNGNLELKAIYRGACPYFFITDGEHVLFVARESVLLKKGR